MRKFIVLISSFFLFSSSILNAHNVKDYTQFVNPFIGTGGHGHTFPGACVPNGLVQLSPTTDSEGWDWASGYHMKDDKIMGFSHTHLSGTGVGDLGNLLLMPRVSNIITLPGTKEKPYNRASQRFNKETEKASVGYYSVMLKESGVKVELTATAHCGMHAYTFPATDSAQIFIDPMSEISDHAAYAKLKIENDSTITGKSISFGWFAPFQQVYYVMVFSRKFDYYQLSTWDINWMATMRSSNLLNGGVYFRTSENEKILVKVGISTVSVENAQENLKKEMPNFHFDNVVQQAKQAWNKVLSTIEVEGGETEKEIFYTGMYHAYIQPNNIADINGQYRNLESNVATSSTGNYYSTFSLWDTYRAAHPLYTLLTPTLASDMIKSMIVHHELQGFLPIWTLWGAENYCMIGNHAIPVIEDAYFKGLIEEDWIERAYKAIYETSVHTHQSSSWDVLEKYGYFPYDVQGQESVSRTLETCFDDGCVASMSKALGKKLDYEQFAKRATNYLHLFDASTGFFRAKKSDGTWMPNFNPLDTRHSHGYTEANAWQYLWSVQHNIPDLVRLLGGKKGFEMKLDSLFNQASTNDGHVSDVSGLIGQYAHGNEPSHHVAYLYNYAGRYDKTQRIIRRISTEMYKTTPDGYAGNEDCGQMSAWYIFSALGFYPVNPASATYDLGVPLFKSAKVNLPNGKTFSITTNFTTENDIAKSVWLNGKKLNRLTITHQEIVAGGELKFTK